jgi:fused signal recognition particle receptor
MDGRAEMERVMDEQVAGARDEVLLVLDACNGQDAIRQAEEFTESVDVTGLVLTKLDGTAKGGIVIGVSHQFEVPVKYIGIGEDIEDLQVFDREAYVETLFSEA